MAVSLNRDGITQAGGGTSIYQNELIFSQACSVNYGIQALFGNDTYLIYSANTARTQASLRIATIGSSPLDESIVYDTATDIAFYELKVLSRLNGIFVGIREDASTASVTGFIAAGRVDEKTYAIELGNEVEYNGGFSLNPHITRLSDNSFAISYYNISSDFLISNVLTRYGKK
jgi:hypothetical protein